jgi:hypothetical protein
VEDTACIWLALAKHTTKKSLFSLFENFVHRATWVETAPKLAKPVDLVVAD